MITLSAEQQCLMVETGTDLLMEPLREQIPWKYDHTLEVGIIADRVLARSGMNARDRAFYTVPAVAHDAGAAATSAMVDIANDSRVLTPRERKLYVVEHTVKGVQLADSVLVSDTPRHEEANRLIKSTIGKHHALTGTLAERAQKKHVRVMEFETVLLTQVIDRLHARTMPRPYPITDASRTNIVGRMPIEDAQAMARQEMIIARSLFDIPTKKVIEWAGHSLRELQAQKRTNLVPA